MNYVEAVHTLLELGADVDPQNRARETPLMLAARHGHDDIIPSLIASGAEPNHLDVAGWAALHYAVMFGHVGTVQLLLDNGANPHTRTPQEMRPIAMAIWRALQGGDGPGPLPIFLSRGSTL